MVEKARFTPPYMDLHLALVVRDDQKSAFDDLDAVKRTDGLRIAVAGDADYERAAAEIFPRATIVPLDDPGQFFNRTDADALLTTAETGTPLTLLHPFYTVAACSPPAPPRPRPSTSSPRTATTPPCCSSTTGSPWRSNPGP